MIKTDIDWADNINMSWGYLKGKCEGTDIYEDVLESWQDDPGMTSLAGVGILGGLTVLGSLVYSFRDDFKSLFCILGGAACGLFILWVLIKANSYNSDVF
jgi:hypothetical protein